MAGFWSAVAASFAAMDTAELAAVILAIVYLLLVVRENIWCWGAAFVSTSIYLVLFFDVRLYMESALQVFYLAMAVYGWWQWRSGGRGGGELKISTWPVTVHAGIIAAIAVLSMTSGWLLDTRTAAAFPYLDSFTTWSAVVTTYMVTRKILENWIYWFVIDGISIYLYSSRGMYLTALLFVLYVVLVVFGYRRWRRHYRAARVAVAT